MLFGTGWHVTLGLVFCSAYLWTVVRVPFGQCLGIPGFLILATLATYLWIGGTVAVLTDSASLLDNIVVMRVVLAAAVVIAAALGAAAALQRIGADRLLVGILCIQVATCVAMLMTPFLVDHVYSLSGRLWFLEEEAQYRLLGTFVNPNDAGIAACQGVVTALALLGSRKHVKLAILALVIAFVATVLSFSRAAILALAVVCLFFLRFVVLARGPKLLLVSALVVAGVVKIAFFPLTHDLQLERLTSFFDGTSDIRTAWLWPLTLSQIAESPLFGHGITLDHAIAMTKRCTAATVCSPHNSYLMLWREAGMVPLTLFLFFVFAMLYGGLKTSHSTARGVVVGWALVFALYSLTSDNVLYSTAHAFIVGLSCALMRCRPSAQSGVLRQPLP